MKTLVELQKEMDDAASTLWGYDITNHYAYLKWSPAKRIEFDVEYAKARQRATDTWLAYRCACEQAALNDTDPLPKE